MDMETLERRAIVLQALRAIAETHEAFGDEGKARRAYKAVKRLAREIVKGAGHHPDRARVLIEKVLEEAL